MYVEMLPDGSYLFCYPNAAEETTLTLYDPTSNKTIKETLLDVFVSDVKIIDK